jgi:hypothetical protein
MTGFSHQPYPAVDAGGNYFLRLPTAFGTIGDSLRRTNVPPYLEWYRPPSAAAFESYRSDLPMKYAASAVTTANVILNGPPAAADTDDVDFAFGGFLLVRAQTDPSENGLWTVNPGGDWARNVTMPDNGSSAFGALITVGPGGTRYGNTIWFSQADGSGPVPLVQVVTQPYDTFSVPRMTTTDRDALTAVDGMLIYNTTAAKFQGREAGAWVNLI